MVKHADAPTSPGTPTGAFAELHRSPPGTRAGPANALTHEFLGDYVYAVATRDLWRGRVERHPQRG